jgi:hypothetical protein
LSKLDKELLMDRTSFLQNRRVALQVESLEERCVPSSAEYVSGLYNSILHRNPAPAEVAGWVNVLDAGASPQEVALAFTTSQEYSANVIRAEYALFLGRQASPVEVAGWLQALQAGFGEKQVEASFLSSEEFFRQQGATASTWLKGVYNKVLGRAPDPAGLSVWSQDLVAGLSRWTVALAILDSPEADTRLVSTVYRDLLQRDPDPSGLATWVAKLQQGLSPSDLIASIASSDEFIGLTAHGLLDMPSAPPTSVADAVPDPYAFASFCDPFLEDPFRGCMTVVTDSGPSEGSSNNPGTDSGGFDTTVDCGSDDGTFDSITSVGGDDDNEA